jgi:integrase
VARKRQILFRVKESNFTKNGRTWFIVGYPQGKPSRIWFKTEKEAKKAANERNAEITATGTLDQLPYTLRITTIEGSKELEARGDSLANAISFRLKHLDKKESISVAELVRRFLVETDRRLAENEIVDREAETVKWATTKLAARFGEMLLLELTGSEIKAWIAAMSDLATKTKNRILGYNRQMFSIAREWGLISVNPLAEISKFKRRPSVNSEDEIQVLTVEELTDLLCHVDRRLVPYITIGAFAGLRDAEIKRLDWSEISLGKRQIEVKARKAKTALRRFVQISDNLFDWLQSFAQAAGPVIPLSSSPGHVGKPSRKLVYELRKSARIAAGMVKWKPNALRHSFCSYHYAMHEDAGKTAAQAGHTSPATTFANYRELVTKEAAERYWAIRP